MNISNEKDNQNLISTNFGFFLYELMGVDYSGTYIANVELKKIADSLGMELKLVDNHKMFGELLRVAKEQNRLKESLVMLLELYKNRAKEYEELKMSFEGASEPIDMWIIKNGRAVKKIEKAILELQNETK